ncbi:DUF7344 domain-containing protein [Halegenticoccus tardaugens]|uniref:DUF7344 domain-containing protein n=1 Tax=Halegenticoccus tardaugens TaxID=2071624 RepID=UPI00100BF0D1|nr:hypothetical protein [Halegenticoccus tardaugens]
MEGENPGEDDVEAAPADAVEHEESILEAGVLDLQYVFDALAHTRRRYLLYTLLEKRAWTLTELATKIAAWERDVSEDAVTAADRDRVYVSLLHLHVPKLAADDIVTFSSDEETIEKGPNAEQVLAVLGRAGASLDSAQEVHARKDYDDRTR